MRDFPTIVLREFRFNKSNIKVDLKLDSLDRVSLIVGIEAEFKTLFSDNVFENFQTVDDIVLHLSKDKGVY